MTDERLLREVRDWFDNYVRRGIGTTGWVPQGLNDALCDDYDARHPTINLIPTDSSLIVGRAV